MIIKSPSLAKPITLWTFTAVSLVSSFGVLWEIRELVWALNIVTLAWGGILSYEYVGYKVAMVQRVTHEAQSRTEEVRKLELISGMTKDQFEFLRQNILVIRVILSNLGKVKIYQWQFQEIPDHFVIEFIRAGDGDYLCPIRRYPEGSAERDWAIALTDMLVTYDFASIAKGNRSARWSDHQSALEFLELEEVTTQ